MSSKYLDVTSNGEIGTIHCRICQEQIYYAPIHPGLDRELMEIALEHFDIKHDIARTTLAEDCELAFMKEMSKSDKEKT